MIEHSDVAADVMTGSYAMYCSVESWRDGVLLADDVPVDSGYEEVTRADRVPERVTLTVPRTDRGVDWTPTTEDHPLAAKGQRLHVRVGVGLDADRIEWLARGWYLVDDVRPYGDTITVQAAGLLLLADEARLVSPLQPSGTLGSTLRDLLEPAVTVRIDPLLADRSVPSGINMDEDRLGAVLALLDAWPAAGRMHPGGFFDVGPVAAVGAPVLELTDGVGGTVVEVAGTSTREGSSNVVVARGTAADGGQVQGVAYDYSGPNRYQGPFNPLPVPTFFSSPLLTTVLEATTAAQTIIDRLQRNAGRRFVVEAVPYLPLQDGDVVAVTSERYGLDAVPCTVEVLRMPWTPGAGAMVATVQEVVT